MLLTTSAPKVNKGAFKPGPDARRHTFTPQECSDGFHAALESIVRRYGIHCTDSAGRHMVCNFGKYLTRQGRMKPRA